MTQELTVFKDKKIRIEVIGEDTCFCLNHICDEVGIKNVGNVIKRLHDTGIRTMDVAIQTETGTRTMAFVNESGLYAVIGKSRKPKCKELYQQLIIALPGLRKQAVTQAVEPSGLNSTSALKEFVRGLTAMVDKMEILESRMDAYETKQQAVTAVLAPVKPISLDAQINMTVRQWVNKNKDNSKVNYPAVYNHIYYEFYYRYHRDLKQIAQNRNITGVQAAVIIGMAGELLGLVVHLTNCNFMGYFE